MQAASKSLAGIIVLALSGYSVANADDVISIPDEPIQLAANTTPAKPSAAATPSKQGTSAPTADASIQLWSIGNWQPLAYLGVDSWSDVFHRGQWDGYLEASVDQWLNQIKGRNQPTRDFTTQLVKEKLNIGNRGFYLVDPRLVNGNIDLTFTLQQGRQNSGNSTSTQNGVLTGYNIGATVLGEQPYYASFFANKLEEQSTSSGGTTQKTSEHSGATLWMREDNLLREKEILPWFSGNLQFLQEKNHSDSSYAGKNFSREDERTLSSLNIHNGFETADLEFRAQHNEVTNKNFSAGSYSSDKASLDYNLDFGEGLNMRWSSRLSYLQHNGASSLRDIDIDEALAVAHFSNLASAYYYHAQQQSISGSSVDSQTFAGSAQYTPFANVTTNAGLTKKLVTMTDGRTDTTSSQLGMSYGHGLPWAGWLSASANGSLQVDDVKLKTGRVPAIQTFIAPHNYFSDPGYLIPDQFVDQESKDSIQVFDNTKGLPAQEGVDYQKLCIGDQCRIRILPSTNGPTGIDITNDVDVIQVNYTFLFDPSIKYQTTARSMSMGANWSWIGFSGSHEESEQKPISKSDASYLNSRSSDTARLNMQGGWNNIHAYGDASMTRHYDTSQTYTETRAYQSLSYQPPQMEWKLGLNANEYSIDYVSPQQHQNSGIAVELYIDSMAYGWYSTARLSRRETRDSEVGPETSNEANLQLRRRWSLLDLVLKFNLVQHTSSSAQTMNAGFHALLTRRF